MTPACYVDLLVSGADDHAGAPVLVLRSRCFAGLHAAFQQSPGRHAVALPPRRPDTLRVFASNAHEVETLVRRLHTDRWFRDYVRVDAVAAVPDGWAGPRVAYVRYRIPTARSDRHAVDGVSALRDRRLATARSRQFDHFNVRSASNGFAFSLTVERLADAGLPLGGTPNSYGLSTRQNPLGLPAID